MKWLFYSWNRWNAQTKCLSWTICVKDYFWGMYTWGLLRRIILGNYLTVSKPFGSFSPGKIVSTIIKMFENPAWGFGLNFAWNVEPVVVSVVDENIVKKENMVKV